MPRYAHNDFLNGGADYLPANADKAILTKDFSTIYAAVNGALKVAEAALVGGDFAVAGGDVTGTATAGGASTLTDSGKAWTTNEHAGRLIEITGGTGAGQYRTISSNTGTEVTVSAPWTTAPDATSTYKIATPRVVTATLTGKSAGNAAQAVADGTNMHVAFVNVAASKVIYVAEESSNQAITNGNPVTFNSNPTYSAGQPTA